MRRDLEDYYHSMTADFEKAQKIAEKVNKEIQLGLVTEEQKANFDAYFTTVKANYDRVSYMIHLLNLPPKFIQRFRNNKLLKEQKKRMAELMNASKEAVEAENDEALDSAEKLANELDSEGKTNE